jgi:hypothetical protein
LEQEVLVELPGQKEVRQVVQEVVQVKVELPDLTEEKAG